VSNGNGDVPLEPEVNEAAMIRAIAEALAARFGLDTAEGKLMDRPVLMLLFMCEQLLNRAESMEEALTKIGKELQPRIIT
jgi:hypothetical protein